MPAESGGASVSGAAIPAGHGGEETLDVNFPNEDFGEIIRKIAALYSLDVKIPPGLSDRASLKLRDVTWRQIFDVLLQPIGYAYVAHGRTVMIMTIEDFDRLPLVTNEYECIFIPAQEIAARFSDNTKSQYSETVRVAGHVVTARVHPSRVEFFSKIFARTDGPRASDPHQPWPEWPDEIPAEVFERIEPTEPWDRPGPAGLLETNIYVANWVNCRSLAARIRPLLGTNGDRIQVEDRSNALIVTTDGPHHQTVKRVCQYLDDRAWYFRAARAAAEHPAEIEGDHAGLVRRDHFCVFAPAERFALIVRDHLSPEHHEDVFVAGQTLAIFVHPDHVAALDALLDEADRPGRIPYFPPYLQWPEVLPAEILELAQTTTGKPVPEPANADDTTFYPLQWVDAARVAEQLSPLLDSPTERLVLDRLENRVGFVSNRVIFWRACEFLDRREWYRRPAADARDTGAN